MNRIPSIQIGAVISVYIACLAKLTSTTILCSMNPNSTTSEVNKVVLDMKIIHDRLTDHHKHPLISEPYLMRIVQLGLGQS